MNLKYLKWNKQNKFSKNKANKIIQIIFPIVVGDIINAKESDDDNKIQAITNNKMTEFSDADTSFLILSISCIFFILFCSK